MSFVERCPLFRVSFTTGYINIQGCSSEHHNENISEAQLPRLQTYAQDVFWPIPATSVHTHTHTHTPWFTYAFRDQLFSLFLISCSEMFHQNSLQQLIHSLQSHTHIHTYTLICKLSHSTCRFLQSHYEKCGSLHLAYIVPVSYMLHYSALVAYTCLYCTYNIIYTCMCTLCVYMYTCAAQIPLHRANHKSRHI